MRENDDNIVIYFKRNLWKNLSDIERNRYRNVYKIYAQCLVQGKRLYESVFSQISCTLSSIEYAAFFERTYGCIN